MMDWDSFNVEKVANGYIAYPREGMGSLLNWSKTYYAPTITSLGALIDSVIQQMSAASSVGKYAASNQ
jgi:hypothetical protein